MNNISWSK